MANDEKTFAWHRPKDVATSIFLDFTGEVEEAVGVGNAALLEDGAASKVRALLEAYHRVAATLLERFRDANG